jgi:hypothetical protein
MSRKILVVTFGLLALAAVAPAHAEDQTVTATLGTSVSMSTAPTATVSNWSLSATGANTTSGGDLVVASNVPYKVTVASDKATMSEWDGAAYVTSGKSLTAPMSVLTTLTGGAGLPVASLAVGTLASNVATGTGLSTDTYSITLSQTTAITDAPLSGGNSYRIKLTYTASSTI